MSLDRRQFCAALAGPVLAAQSAPPALIDRGFARVSKLADGVYVTIADPSKGPQCLSNGGILVGRDRTLLVEGHFQPAGAALEIEAAGKLSKAPILAAVNTHFHLDHTFGNQAYAERRIPIMAHSTAPALMKKQYGDLKGVDKTGLMKPLRSKINEAMDPLQKKRLESDLEADQWMYQAIDATTITYPTELLSADQSPKKIDLGGLTVVIESHPGHTPTDLIIRIPDHDIVFTGDLLFYRDYPVAIDANMRAWRKVLDMFHSYGSKMRFVPGHGPVCGIDVVREQMDLFDDLQSQAEKMKAAGISLDEAKRRYTVPARFHGFDDFSWRWTIGAAIGNYSVTVH
jgi:glyoxylase-like metal-dependent hydrolase (beta-lactamase superfamily II)